MSLEPEEPVENEEPDINERLQAQTLMLARIYDVLIAQMVMDSMPDNTPERIRAKRAVVEKLYEMHANGGIGNPELFIVPESVMNQ